MEIFTPFVRKITYYTGSVCLRGSRLASRVISRRPSPRPGQPDAHGPGRPSRDLSPGSQAVTPKMPKTTPRGRDDRESPPG